MNKFNGRNVVMKKQLLTTILALSLCFNICCGVYIFPKVFSYINGDSATENYKYDARLSTFMLNPNEAKIVFLGDSITAYLDWNEFFSSSNLLNRGIEGDTWGGVLHRLSEVTERHPDIIVLMVGVNDVASGASSSDILQIARQTISKIETDLPNTRIILCDILPSPQCSLKVIEDVNTGYADLIQEHDNITYLSLMDLYMNSDGTVNNELFSEDNVHLNGKGYSIWVDELRKVLP